jgi:hypothetical protein
MEMIMRTGFCRWNAIISTFLSLLVLMVIPGIAVSDQKKDVSANCDIQAGACVQPLGGGRVTLEVLPRPVTAMADLTIKVRLENLSPVGEPDVDLGMPGMNMGPNHVTLEKTAEGNYSGSGVIVRCPSGRTLWQADVTIPGAGTAAFIFHVAY